MRLCFLLHKASLCAALTDRRADISPTFHHLFMAAPRLVVIPRIFLFPQACHNPGNECSFLAATGQQSAFLHSFSIVVVAFFLLLSVIVDLYIPWQQRGTSGTLVELLYVGMLGH